MKFKLIHKETKLTFGQYKNRYPLRYYSGGKLFIDNDYKQRKCTPMLRTDGAICFQINNPWYGEGDLHFLHRDDWEVVFNDQIADTEITRRVN